MNKTELVKATADIVGFTQKDVEKCIDAMNEAITSALLKDEMVKTGLFTCTVKETSAKKGRNPKTGEAIDIPARKKVIVKPLKSLSEAIKG